MKEDLRAIEERAEQLVESHAKLMEELLRLRKKNGISQELVGERMGVSQPAVAAFESHDSNPTLGTIRRYALAVGARIEHKVIDDVEVIAIADSGTKRAEEWLAQQPLELPAYSFGQVKVKASAK